MRVRSSALVALAILLLPVLAHADPGSKRGITLGLTGVYPLAPWTDAGLGVAPWAGFTLPAWGKWALTARAGWIQHVDKQLSVGTSAPESIRYKNRELPILLGLEYSRPTDRSWLFSGELGYVLRNTRAEYSHESTTSSTDHGLGLGLGGGYRISSFQARAELLLLNLTDPVKHKSLLFGFQWLLPL